MFAADRERDEKRQQRQLSAPDYGHDERCEHQANRVVNQQGGENSRSERDVQQKARRSSREVQHQFRGPFEKMREIKIGRDEHHAQQQYQRVVVDGAICPLRRHYTGRNHQYRAQQSGSGAIQRENLELAAADENVGDCEDRARNEFPLPVVHTRA